jgi:mannose-6-phosphate isomerase-like protein (cupin superfamily)
VAVPMGVVHSFRNAGDGELRVLNIHSPKTGFISQLRTDS